MEIPVNWRMGRVYTKKRGNPRKQGVLLEKNSQRETHRFDNITQDTQNNRQTSEARVALGNQIYPLVEQ